MQQENGVHIELRQKSRGDMMGKIPSTLGWTAFAIFSLVLGMLLWFAFGFEIENAMQVRAKVQSAGSANTHTITAIVSDRQAGKIQEGSEVLLNLSSLKAKGRVTGIRAGDGDAYIATIEPQKNDGLSEKLSQLNGKYINCEIVTGKQTIAAFFVSK